MNHIARQILIELRDASAPRVFLTDTFRDFATALSEDLKSGRTFDRLIESFASSQVLIKVRRGLFLNGLATPKVRPAEASGYIRRDAVVDLATVLGDCGALNNLATDVICVIPLSAQETTPSVGVVSSEVGNYRFYGISKSVFEAGELEDRLADTSYARSTPEAALLNWLYLANNGRSRLTHPPLDLDLDMLNRKALRRLAQAKGLVGQLASWLSEVEAYRNSADVDANASRVLGF